MGKILLIDDEEAILRVLSMSLRSDGYEVLTAGTGEEGIALFKEESPRIVLTDIKMPGMDGLDVLKEIKALDADAEVIIITGHGDIEVAVEALQYGASDFINKPVQDKALTVALQRAEEKVGIRRQLKAYTQDLEAMVKIATEEFERKARFQEKLIRSSHDGIVATDDEWRVVIFNPGAQEIFGYTRMEVVNAVDARTLYPEAANTMFQQQVAGAVRQGESPWTETLIRSKNGEQIPVRFSGTILKEHEEMNGSVAFFQDLREIKRLERELVKSERLAAIGQTVAGMAHCIKNILHGFKGGSYLVNVGIDKDNSDKLKNGWQMIQRNIGRTSDLVLDLLSYSKEREPDYEACVPNDLADDICELMADVAGDHDIEIVKDFSRDLGEAVLDPRTVHRCLLNLVSNAIDACRFDDYVDKRHRVTLRTLRESREWIRFEVADNGSGIDEEVKAKLFSSFFSTKGAQGTGLGLLVTGKLIEENRGSIRVVSKLGQGTTFIIRLPDKAAVKA